MDRPRAELAGLPVAASNWAARGRGRVKMFDATPGNILDYHRSMLADAVRTTSLERAITGVVRPGDVVLDLGCGTGILACLACRAGARRVYALESGRIIELARAVCRDNGFSDRVVLIPERSTRVELPELVDVVVTETIGNIAFNEGILGWVADARRRFLKPGGVVIPKRLDLVVAPVELPEISQQIDVWVGRPCGLDVGGGRTLAANSIHWVQMGPTACLAEPAHLARVDLAQVDSECAAGTVSVTATRPGVCHGLGAWFSAALTDTVTLSNAPPLRTPSWWHGFFPLLAPLGVAAGDQLQITLDVRGNGALWQWLLRPLPAGSATAADRPAGLQSTFHGQLLSMTSLRKGTLGHVPALSEQGEVDRFVLESMDGVATVAEIAERTAARFPRVFANREDAVERVRKLSRRYSR